jgi:ClpP class serine protease
MIDIYNKPLAILPDNFSDMDFSEKVTALNPEPEKYIRDADFLSRRGSIAVIDIKGAIISRGTWFSAFLGIADTETLAANFQKAVLDPAVSEIVLDIDSPGGMVTGVNEFAGLIRASKKKVTAYIGGTGASAAYWIASAADKIYIDDTARVGGIGVVIGFRKEDGKTVEFVNTASPNKRMDIASDEGKAAIIAEADAIADVFIGAVARNRKRSTEYVKNNFGRGGVFVGASAVASGMVDGIRSFTEVIMRIERRKRMEEITTVKQLAATFPDLVQAIRDDTVINMNVDDMIADAKQKATAAEKDRILALVGVHFGEQGESFGAVLESGITAEQLKVVQAATAKREKTAQLAAIMQTGA